MYISKIETKKKWYFTPFKWAYKYGIRFILIVIDNYQVIA